MQDFTPYEAKRLRKKHVFPLIRKYLRERVAPTIGTFEAEDVFYIWTDSHLESIRTSNPRFYHSLIAKAVEHANSPT